MGSISTPYSLELTRDEDAKNATADVLPDLVVGKMKVFLGSGINPSRKALWRGALDACYRKLMNEVLKKELVPGTDWVARVVWDRAVNALISLENDTLGVTDNDVAIVIESTFAPNSTHFATETFDQLMEVLTEHTKAN